ncbi:MULTISPECIES: CHAT domain-containing protein [Okeania]|uniref:CHAT domain-containing protein n=3 Tax=Okeania TaxID=1458928 RepID=A0A3N6RLS2_9CYAN|nr:MULTISPECIES: CHAT domain-containing protein [Okeania]NET16554.1 CHAT domain-containing protein [Okeania sp. SIO1H6]NES78677.1 CHAT domain-containing protein [Okeania sp. SIO1H4]NET22194.1 CHAT domain-containing protein [Okeania sp. SIO1H5]NET80354.1 CHAT domain-containing protein [Okeania sp. SIO1F9]NET95169.1 CHAT domain-containing protein [Okeania sp. SIO1H2]
MQILHLNLKLIGDDYAQFRYFWNNPNDYQSYQLSLTEISALIEKLERGYYTRLPDEYAKTGQRLYNWLDGNDRILQRELDKNQREGIVLAISTSERLAHLPWELLHDDNGFLVQRKPAIIPVRWMTDNQQLFFQNQPHNRALNVVFIASSPRNTRDDFSELDFEAEEGSILEATKRSPLYLEVEESGCLTELGYLVESQEENFFDVVHLTGHAKLRNNKPCFVTETEYGEAEYSSAEDIATELQFQHPKLIFLSGCGSGYSHRENIPSMAESLLSQGATAVLGWGDRVLDTDATTAAAKLYQGLSSGKGVTVALAETYQELIKVNARDWHKLRLYVAGSLPGALVTPLRKPGRKPAPRYQKTIEFRDPEGKLRVATRQDFVGRRRQLQNCLRAFKLDEKLGVLIHGMGGLGKSTIASRLWERLSEYENVLWWRQIDNSNLVEKLADKLRDADLRFALKNNQDELKYRLRDLFENLIEAGEKPFLFLFDDFEWNLEPREGGYVLKPEAAEVLNALVFAIREVGAREKIIITCRYEFQSDLLNEFWVQGLDAFRKADLEKKLKRLENFKSGKVDEKLIARALKLADGNARLLEWLDKDVLGCEDIEEKLSQLESGSEDWQGKIILSELYAQVDKKIVRVLSHCLVFEIPVPMLALEAVCESISGYKEQLNRGIDLGLIEVSSEVEESERLYRVSRILPRIISSIKLPGVPDVYSLYEKGLKKLFEVWGRRDNRSQEKWREIFRLMFANKENSQRFRRGFYQMLDADFSEVDEAYESELRQSKTELSEDNFYVKLEEYLCQDEWIKADEETAFILYQVMALNNIHKEDIHEEIPLSILRKIDQIWVKYSKGKFGFSVLEGTYQNLVSTRECNEQVWEAFCNEVGWREVEWLDDSDLTSGEYTFGLAPSLLQGPCVY